MSKHKIVSIVGFFNPTEKVLFQSRYKFLINLAAKYIYTRGKHQNTPMKIVYADGQVEFLNGYLGFLEKPEERVDYVGDKILNRNDVLEIKEGMITGAADFVGEIPEEQIIKELESLPPKQEIVQLTPEEMKQKIAEQSKRFKKIAISKSQELTRVK